MLKIQICDGPHGCGRIITDSYETEQQCDWFAHEDDGVEYFAPGQPWRNAPLMRRTEVIEPLLDGKDPYAESLREQAEYAGLPLEEAREIFERFLNLPYARAKELMSPQDRLFCICVYRLTKQRGAFRSLMKTLERRSPLPQQREHAKLALLAYMEHYSESRYAAGWLSRLDETIAEDPVGKWLIETAGGVWTDHDTFVEDDDDPGARTP